MVLKLSSWLIALSLLPTIAHADLGGGGDGGCCGDFVKFLPIEQRALVVELQKQFYLKSDDELDRITFDESQTCKIVECGILEPTKVVKLANLVKEDRRFVSSDNRSDRQLWIALGAMFVSLLSLTVAFFNYRKPK